VLKSLRGALPRRALAMLLLPMRNSLPLQHNYQYMLWCTHGHVVARRCSAPVDAHGDVGRAGDAALHASAGDGNDARLAVEAVGLCYLERHVEAAEAVRATCA
jgi:hypothetical protein